MPSGKETPPDLVEDLLSLPTWQEKSGLLRGAGLLDAEGIGGLLDAAERALYDNPERAHRLVELCARLAEEADVPALVPRVDYVRVQTHFINGEFDAALRMTESARSGYAEQGMALEALRTNVGKMAALIELGRYREALGAGRLVLDTLDGKRGAAVRPTARERKMLVALVQQNRGGCLEHMGLYQEALDAYAESEEGYRDLGLTERLGEVLDNRGNILSYLGQGSEALASHEAAAAIFEEADLTVPYAMSLSNIGETHLWLADYTSSLKAFEQARRLLSATGAPVVEYFLRRNTADAYLALNLYSEALSSYQEADDLLRGVGMEHDHARALWGMGSALMARSELGEAEEALDEAVRLFAAADNAPMLSGAMIEQSSLLAARGRQAPAQATARRALELVSEDEWPVQHVYARLRLADLLLPDAAAAEPHLLAARRLADLLALPQLRFRSNERLGHLRRLQGRDEEALALLEAAVDEVERLRGSVAQDALRASFLRDKTAAYEDLLQLHLARGDDASVRRAFGVAEQAKSRTLVDLLTGVAQRTPAGAWDPGSLQSIRTLQADLNATFSRMLGISEEVHAAPLRDLRDRAVSLEREISRLRLRAAAAGSSPDPFSAPASPDDAVGGLPRDAALIAYHTVGDEIMAFAATGGAVRAVRHVGTLRGVWRLLRRLDVHWGRTRVDREFAERHTSMLERSARQVLAALHQELLGPLEGFLKEAADTDGTGAVPGLVVVPHASLHRVPFHALFDGESYLIERFEISYAPSVAVYALCQEREMRDRDNAAVFGVEDASIPAAAAEARAVAQQLPSAALRIGEDATVGALLDMASSSGILHLACHGLFRPDNPMFSSLKLHDNWLLATDVMSLHLPGALVTLSACESGRSEVIGGDEILGLTRAFLGAGAAALVVSLWLVQDESTAQLMKGWYAHLREGKSLASALRAAQLDLKDRYPHPYHWASFVLIGRR